MINMENKMPALLERCAGIDIHKKTAVATIMIGFGEKMKKQTKTFGTMTSDLRDLADWLTKDEIEQVVIESTGSYWIPVFNILEGEYKLDITLANPYQVKNVPHRKSDVKDSEWLCYLLKHGLINRSFIPPIDIRRFKELVRFRGSLIQALTASKNRLIKTLESKNIKLASVLSSVYSITGFKVLRLIAQGEVTPDVLAACFKQKVKATKTEIKKAVTGTLIKQDIKLLAFELRDIDEKMALISDVEKEIDLLASIYREEIGLLKTIPGIGDKVAMVIIAEAGTKMSAFPSEQHFASWTGLAPRTNESAGKRKNTSISGGNHHIRKAFIEAAWAAVRVKNSYWCAEFHRLKPRLGSKKAIVAIARKLACCVYATLGQKAVYVERGANGVIEKHKQRRILYHQKMLKKLGVPNSTSAPIVVPPC